MSVYINPKTESKEAFLSREGKEIPFTRGAYPKVPEGQRLVVWVNSGPFTAAGVIEDEKDFQGYSPVDDYRPGRAYLVPAEKLIGVVPDSQLDRIGLAK